jgi:hypothetical protein
MRITNAMAVVEVGESSSRSENRTALMDVTVTSQGPAMVGAFEDSDAIMKVKMII